MICSICGARVRDNMNFCTSCGVRMVQDASGAAQAAAPQQPGDDALRIDDLRPVLVPVEYKYVSDRKLVMKNPAAHTYVEMSAEDVVFLQYMDGRHTVTQILKEVYEQTGRMSFKRLFNLLVELYASDFLATRGMQPLKAAAQGAGLARSRHPLTRFAEAVNGLQIPLEFLAIPMRGVRFLVAPLLKLPVLGAIFLLCVAPALIASVLATKQAASMGAMRDSLYAIMSLFSAPDQKGYNIFTYDMAGHESYALGLAFAYLAAFVVLSFRSLVRGAALLALGCEAYRPALRIYFGILFIDIDGRDIVMADRKGRMTFYAVGIIATLVIGTAINIVQNLTQFNHLLYLIYLIAYMITFINLCVFFRSDLFNLLDNYYEIPQLRKHALKYITQKFFQQVLSVRSSFNEEKALTTLACLAMLWLYIAVAVFFTLIRVNMAMLINDFGDAAPVEKVAIGILLFNMLGPLCFVMISTLVLVLRNVAKIIGTPLGRVLRGIAARRRRQPADPEEIAGFIARIPLFMNLTPEERMQIAAQFHQVQFKPGQNVVVQGDPGNAFFVLAEGAVDVIIEDPSGLQTTIDTLNAGDSFGEIALLENVPRTATIRARAHTVALELDKQYFDEFVSRSAGAKERITDVIRLTATLRKNPFFQELAPSRIPDVISRLSKIPVARGNTIIREGDPGDNFYIISDGAFQVLKATPEKQNKIIARLDKHGSFGEIALLNNMPRTSSVVAETDGLLLSLERDDFLAIAHANINAGLVMEEQTERRMAELNTITG